MSAELGRDHEDHFAVSRRDGAWVKDCLDACSFGPFGYFQAALVGFVLGTVVFLAVDAAVNPAPGQLNELPIFFTCACGSSVLLVCLAFAGNYLIGRRIRDEVELERAIFGAGTLPPPQPRPDVPGLDLRPDPRTLASAGPTPLPRKTKVEAD
jgi:hypothetical protein